jgi:hypothetical protein
VPFTADDPHQAEQTVELDPLLWTLYQQAQINADGWQLEADKLKAKVIAQIGDAYAATVDGIKVAYYRPTAKYAESRLVADNPDLVQHFMKWQRKEIFDLEAFMAQHPDVAERYRVRSFRRAKERE